MESDFLIHRWLTHPPAPSANSFVTLPILCLPGDSWQVVYEIAWQQAQMQNRPSILERDWLAVCN